MAIEFSKASKETAAKASTGGANIFFEGSESQEALEHEDKKAQQSSGGNIFRFWMAPGEEDCSLTFLDGALDEYGELQIKSYYEHQIYLNGSWRNYFPCVRKLEPCPLCETNEPYLCGVFTVVDHRNRVSKKNGKTYKDTTKLFACKRHTLKLLRQYAKKRGGLAGCTFDVVRTGDKEPAVGNMFDFTEKTPVEEIKKKFNVDVIDYSEVIQLVTADELRARGFGSTVVGTDDTQVSGVVDSNL